MRRTLGNGIRNFNLFRDAEAQITAYMSGRLQTFDMPIRFEGTPFQRRVWQAIAAIPFGTTLSYSALAERIGAPSSMRAVGAATGRNPISLIVPCHRVVGRDGAPHRIRRRARSKTGTAEF
ncbi:MAG: methylated-DNA--[protein]-cysteine S-methyltransferase [Candidatus Manganitrophus sp.]|nr:methylated-DNA--[protein]-cysteine S-methyltransferase [Candidatus Manganitrophus sp.]